ncbi:hypothetical protein INR49_006244 [Caranx melampygus]|nr:hypothetical protein INR49_006244 [Caranx melampygus]
MTKYSAMFLNGEIMGEVNSGNPVSGGLCSSNEKTPVLFGENSTSGCLLSLSRENLTQCNLLRETVASLQAALTTATYVSKRGNPDSLIVTDWVNISFTFTDIPLNTGPPKTRFQINFTEYDCDRNDVCWPELAFPITKYYTGEPHSQALAKGLILVFFFIVASILGTPWRQIRQAWKSAAL